ncbi:MAG: methylenetetrahydrofolate reductase [bacterium]
MKLHDLTRTKGFVKIVEFSPPRGTGFKNLLEDVEAVRDLSDFIAITHNPGGKPRIDSHYTSGLIKREKGVEPICHFRTIDGNRIDLYGKLMATGHMGIENLLVIQGDSPKKETYPEFCSVNDYRHSWEFIADIARLNRGEPTDYMSRLFSREEIEKSRQSFTTDFSIGAAGHPLIAIDPTHPSAEAREELENIRMKVASGADFILTQIVYDETLYIRYREAVYETLSRSGIEKRPPIIPGILPILSLATVRFLEEAIREVSIPEKTKKALRESDDPVKEGIKIARDLIQRLKEAGAPGVNLFARTRAERIRAILEE